MNHQQAMTTHAAERYLLNELPEADRDAFEAHYFECAACAEDVRVGALLKEGVQSGMAGPALASRQAAKVVSIAPRRAWRAGQALPWAAAAALAIVAGYQGLWVMPGLREQLAPQAVSPVALRPASRGSIATIVPPRQGVVAFALDLNAVAAPPTLTYDLRTVDGESVASGVAATPPAGTPLLLLVPVSALEARSTYVLSVRGGDADPALAEYRFAVAEQ
jgi:hypothetical protein